MVKVSNKNKLSMNWGSLVDKYPQLRGYENGAYIIECITCHKPFRALKLDFVMCVDCAKKKTPFTCPEKSRKEHFSVDGLR